MKLQQLTEGRAGAERWYWETIEKAVYEGIRLGRHDVRAAMRKEQMPEEEFKAEIKEIVQRAMDTFNEGY